MSPRFLSHAEVDTVIRLAPLIAIDLIIRNARDEVLITPQASMMPSWSAYSSISTTTTVPAMADTAPITSCLATNSDGRAQLSRDPTTSTANCGGGRWPSC